MNNMTPEERTEENEMSGHTPGPWRIVESYMGEFLAVERPKEGGFVVQGVTLSRALADAYLIAAAPDLLESLESITEMIQDRITLGQSINPWDFLNQIQQSRAAIAKAIGKE